MASGTDTDTSPDTEKQAQTCRYRDADAHAETQAQHEEGQTDTCSGSANFAGQLLRAPVEATGEFAAGTLILPLSSSSIDP